MSVHEKIRFIRRAKGLSQDEMAEKLDMCLNAYGNLERGDSELTISRLEQVAQVFEMSVPDLFGFDEKNVFNANGANHGTQQIQSYCTIAYPADYLQLKIDFEKQTALVLQKDSEIKLLHERIADLNRIIKLLEKTQA